MTDEREPYHSNICATLLPYKRCNDCQRDMLVEDEGLKIGKRLLVGRTQEETA